MVTKIDTGKLKVDGADVEQPASHDVEELEHDPINQLRVYNRVFFPLPSLSNHAQAYDLHFVMIEAKGDMLMGTFPEWKEWYKVGSIL